MATSSAPHGPWHVRSLTYPQDAACIHDICKDVYGGTDYLPRMLPVYAARPEHVLLLVAENLTSGRAEAVIGADVRHDMMFIFGLRVHPSARGGGLGKLLMGQVCERGLQHFSRHGPIRSITTQTTTYNSAAQRIISQDMPRLVCRVDYWPNGEVLQAYEKAVGWPAQQAVRASHGTILGHIPGVLEVLAADGAAQALKGCWVQACSTQQVCTALRGIRKAHWRQASQPAPPPWPSLDSSASTAAPLRAAATSAASASACASESACAMASPQDPTPLQSCTPSPAAGHAAGAGPSNQQHRCAPLGDALETWLPGFYDMFPADGPWGEARVQQGQVWLLPDTAGAPQGHGAGPEAAHPNGLLGSRKAAGVNSGVDGGAPHGHDLAECRPYLGVMVLTLAVEGRRWTAGIVSSSSAVTHAALLMAEELQPHFVAFVDQGRLYDDSLQTASNAKAATPLAGGDFPAVFACGVPPQDALVYARSL